MHKVLGELAQGGIDPAALERAKQRYSSDFVRRLETVATRASILADSNTLRGSPDATAKPIRRAWPSRPPT
jgi:predicted Zn-dependent peptidase